MQPDRAGRLPIFYQALEGRIDELTRSLDEGADPNSADKNGFTPLHGAAQSKDPAAVKLLIDHGADVNARNRFGATPIFVALMNAHDDDRGVVGLLLDAGADIDIQTTAGVSPRALAIDTSNSKLKEFLRLTSYEATVDQ